MTNTTPEQLLADVASYYSEKLAIHGQTPQGVDWNGEESQTLRFEQLSRIVDTDGRFSINDVGCGYGALLPFLQTRFARFSYHGNDVSADMVQAAQAAHREVSAASFSCGKEPPAAADYGIASGIFSVRLGHTDSQWKQYIEDTLHMLNRTSVKGFSFNCLTSYSDQDRMRDYLYYADPGYFFDFCKRHFSRNVALLHDYNLYEFTILVRRQT
jgi:SAM-dependent methyltransferase